MAPSLGKLLAIAGTAIVIAVVAVSLLLIDGPDTLRGKRLDERRVGDLRQIAQALDCYWTKARKAGLPADLPALRAANESFDSNAVSRVFCVAERYTDPLTDELYGYRPLDSRTYELCAEFAEAGEWKDRAYSVPPRQSAEWDHPAGYHCFRRSAVAVNLIRPTAKP